MKKCYGDKTTLTVKKSQVLQDLKIRHWPNEPDSHAQDSM